jgi:hypothetical protein
MGGQGSGGHNSKGKRRDVQCARLDIHELTREGKLKLGTRGRLFGVIGFEVTGGPDAQHLVLEFPCRSASGEPLEPVRQDILCYWRKAHYGGRTSCSRAANATAPRGSSMLGTTITITASGFSGAASVLASPISPPWATGGTARRVASRSYALGSNGARSSHPAFRTASW